MSVATREAQRIEKQEAAAKLGGWEQLVRDVSLPMDIHAAVFTGRTQLLAAAVRPMDANEVRQVLDLVAVLIETNRALQQHSCMVARRVEQLVQGIQGSVRALDLLEDFANFRNPDDDSEDDT